MCEDNSVHTKQYIDMFITTYLLARLCFYPLRNIFYIATLLRPAKFHLNVQVIGDIKLILRRIVRHGEDVVGHMVIPAVGNVQVCRAR
jgi:hypothetical protein